MKTNTEEFQFVEGKSAYHSGHGQESIKDDCK